MLHTAFAPCGRPVCQAHLGPALVRRGRPARVHCVSKADTQVLDTIPRSRLFVFGLGYVGRAVATLARSNGWTVAGTCATEEEAKLAHDLGLSNVYVLAFPLSHDSHCPDGFWQDLKLATHILSTVPPTRSLPVVAPGAVDAIAPIVKQVLQGEDAPSRQRHARRTIGYVSSTGVYGDYGGAWVDETSATRTRTDRGLQRLRAENEWKVLTGTQGQGRALQPCSLTVFRLGGVYGPGRYALVRGVAGRETDRDPRWTP
eukprot:scaffold2157_cov376-Prasinococcus_capsulatus_cf.AAC.8